MDVQGMIAVVSLVLAAVAFLAAWYWWSHPRYGTLTMSSQVVPLQMPRSKDVSVFYKERRLSTPHICTIRAANTGSTQVHYAPSQAQALKLTVTPRTFGTRGATYILLTPEQHAAAERPQTPSPQREIHILQAPEGQIQQVEEQVSHTIDAPVQGNADGSSLTPNEHKIMAETWASWMEPLRLDNGGLEVPMQEIVLEKGEELRWTILSDGPLTFLPTGRIVGTKVLVAGSKKPMNRWLVGLGITLAVAAVVFLVLAIVFLLGTGATDDEVFAGKVISTLAPIIMAGGVLFAWKQATKSSS